ncbi:MAG TPA: peptidylprolyl isomerase, partial [Cyclobacteriaceae bacterium]|nr:peptidylprolyl isomerase [Cyclobacteriaceae bacterium]
ITFFIVMLIPMIIGMGGRVLAQQSASTTAPARTEASEKTAKPVLLFSIANKPVYTDEFIRLYKKNHLKQSDFTEEKVNQYLDLFINFKLKVAEAKARGLDTTKEFRKELNTYKHELKKPYLVQKDDLTKFTQEVYERLKEEVKASHILVMVKPEAAPADTLAAYNKIMALKTRLAKGEDFEKLAREFSEDPSAKSNGGNLGYFTALQMVYPFEEAAFNLKPGEISDPVRTRFGYHLIKVIDRAPAKGEVEVSHILLRTGNGQDAKIKNKIFDIYDQLQGGRSWDELCKEYSDDPATKETGGKLRPFGVGAFAAVPEFEKAAFALQNPGEISDPFQSAVGWHILKLERKIPLPAYADVEASLKRRVSRDERMQIADRRQLEQRKKDWGFVEDPQTKQAVFSTFDSTLLSATWKFKGEPVLKGKQLFMLRNRPSTAGEFLAFAQASQTIVNSSVAAKVNELYDSFVSEKIAESEEQDLYAGNAEYRALLNEYREGILLFTVMEKEVWNRDAEDSVGIRQFYEATKENYKAGDRVHARVFSADKRLYDQIVQRLTARDSLRKDEMKRLKLVHGWHHFERGENKIVDKGGWSIGLHPVQTEGAFNLVEIDNLVAPGIKSFEDARTQVASAYQDQVEKKWIAALKNKFPVKINTKGTKSVMKELIPKEK